MFDDWMGWNNIRLFFFDHWRWLLGLGAGCLVFLSMLVFVQMQQSARWTRLNQLNVMKKQLVRTRPVEDVTDVDEPMEGMLPPHPVLHRLGGREPQPITSWGPSVHESSVRTPDIPLQAPPSRSGPSG